MTDPLFDTAALSAATGLSESFFNQARVRGDGPKFIKIGRAVRYRPADIEEWLAARSRASTSAA